MLNLMDFKADHLILKNLGPFLRHTTPTTGYHASSEKIPLLRYSVQLLKETSQNVWLI